MRTRLDEKLLDMLRYFIYWDNAKTSKVGLMKYLFYSDFTFYRDHQKTISNAHYVKLPNGPCPDKWESYLHELIRLGEVEHKSKFFSFNARGDYFVPKAISRPTTLSKQEVDRLNLVFMNLSRYSSTELAKKSHAEIAYINTKPNEKIDLKSSFFIDEIPFDDEDSLIDEDAIDEEARKVFLKFDAVNI